MPFDSSLSDEEQLFIAYQLSYQGKIKELNELYNNIYAITAEDKSKHFLLARIFYVIANYFIENFDYPNRYHLMGIAYLVEISVSCENELDLDDLKIKQFYENVSSKIEKFILKNDLLILDVIGDTFYELYKQSGLQAVSLLNRASNCYQFLAENTKNKPSIHWHFYRKKTAVQEILNLYPTQKTLAIPMTRFSPKKIY